MSFQSLLYLFGFLPLAAIGLLFIRYSGGRIAALLWISAASLLFYGWEAPFQAVFLLLYILISYVCLQLLWMLQSKRLRLTVLWIAILSNIALLIVTRLVDVTHASLSSFLPVAVSFFTLQQIAYLVDSYRHVAGKKSLSEYIAFISFFPKLLAGPIVRHNEIVAKSDNFLRTGLSLLSIGLWKKIVMADALGRIVDPVFATAATTIPDAATAWQATFAYSLQIYFDFSGYTDMALGSALLLGFQLPINFLSPYQATSVRDFWRRWHITLSQFLRDYIYIPLGGSRKGGARTAVNACITMLISGLWHGLGWTFLIWGAIHGMLLVVERIGSFLMQKIGLPAVHPIFKTAVTFMIVSLTWVVFRAPTLATATNMYAGLGNVTESGANNLWDWWIIIAGLAIVWMFPPSQVVAATEPDTDSPANRYALDWGMGMGLLFLWSLAFMNHAKVFIYAQF